jgi:hypothetical protein
LSYALWLNLYDNIYEMYDYTYVYLILPTHDVHSPWGYDGTLVGRPPLFECWLRPCVVDGTSTVTIDGYGRKERGGQSVDEGSRIHCKTSTNNTNEWLTLWFLLIAGTITPSWLVLDARYLRCKPSGCRWPFCRCCSERCVGSCSRRRSTLGPLPLLITC